MTGPQAPRRAPNPLLADLLAAAFHEDRPGIRRVLGLLTDTERRQFARTVRIIVEEQMRYDLDAERRPPAEAEIVREVSPSQIIIPSGGSFTILAPRRLEP